MRVIGLCALALTASAVNTCGLVGTVLKPQITWVDPYGKVNMAQEGEAAGIDRHMDHLHCKMDSEGAVKECEITKCVGNMVPSGKTILLCNSEGKVVPKAGSNIKCSATKEKAAFGVPQLHKKSPFKYYLRFFYGNGNCQGNFISDVSTPVWPLGPGGAKISTTMFGTLVTQKLRAFPGPHDALPERFNAAGGALDWVKTEPIPTKPEYLVATYDATLHMQKYWDFCKETLKGHETGYYVTDDNSICINIYPWASMYLQTAFNYEGNPPPCRKTDISWGTWWMEWPVVGSINIGTLAFIVTPAFLCCNLVVCLVGICACCMCCCKKN